MTWQFFIRPLGEFNYATINMDRVSVLLKSMREIAIMLIAAIEDYLDTPYDRSALAKRRAQIRSMVK